MSKVQNEALENELDDCKAECRASDGCIGFIQKPDEVCINLRFVNKSRCATDQDGFNLFYNGEYVRFSLYRLPGKNISHYPIACKVFSYKLNETIITTITYIYYVFSMVKQTIENYEKLEHIMRVWYCSLCK